MPKYKSIMFLILLLFIFSIPVQGLIPGRTYLQNQHFQHIIAQGDTLFSLAQKYQVNLEQLLGLNYDLNPENLHIGDQVKISINESLDYHVIQPGESLWEISRKYNFSLNNLISYNQILNPDSLHPGEVILLPVNDKRTVRTVLYFLKSTETEKFLIPEERQVPVERNFYKGIIKQLIQGPVTRTDGFMPIPPETEVLSLSVNNGIATVNFSEQIKQTNVGAGSESLLLHAIINSLTEFKEITGVRILVSGRSDVSIGGHIELGGIFTRNLDVVRY